MEEGPAEALVTVVDNGTAVVIMALVPMEVKVDRRVMVVEEDVLVEIESAVDPVARFVLLESVVVETGTEDTFVLV